MSLRILGRCIINQETTQAIALQLQAFLYLSGGIILQPQRLYTSTELLYERLTQEKQAGFNSLFYMKLLGIQDKTNQPIALQLLVFLHLPAQIILEHHCCTYEYNRVRLLYLLIQD